jgi:hypothetical protein
MKKGVLVYISGPIKPTGGHSVEMNVADALSAFITLMKAGIPSFCPHLSAAFPSSHSEIDYEQWLEYDFAIIDRCTHMLMLPRWDTSKGAIRERDYAIAINIPICLDIAWVEELIAEDEVTA